MLPLLFVYKPETYGGGTRKPFYREVDALSSNQPTIQTQPKLVTWGSRCPLQGSG